MREAIHKLHDTNEELQDLNKLLALNYSDEIVRKYIIFLFCLVLKRFKRRQYISFLFFFEQKSMALSQEEKQKYIGLLQNELNERKKDVDEWKVRYF